MSDNIVTDGYGSGYGDGHGSGSGYGDGDGYGHGYGHGYGSGYGYGDTIGTIGGHTVRTLPPWRFVVVGCQCHDIDWWRQNWQSVAKENKVSVSSSQVEELLCKVTSCAVAQTDVR